MGAGCAGWSSGSSMGWWALKAVAFIVASYIFSTIFWTTKRFFDKERATELRDEGWGQIRIARELGIGVGRVNEWVRDEYIPLDQRAKVKNAIERQDDD